MMVIAILHAWYSQGSAVCIAPPPLPRLLCAPGTALSLARAMLMKWAGIAPARHAKGTANHWGVRVGFYLVTWDWVGAQL